MCEDRALRMRKGCSARSLRLSQLRFRARLLQRFQQAVPALPDSDSSNDSDQLQVNSPAPPPTAETRTLDHITRIPFSGDICVKAQPNSRRARNEGLIDIAMRTVSLMKRNQQLHRRLAILKAETQEFIKSVMNNPENKVNFSTTTTTVTESGHHSECSPSKSEASSSSSEQSMAADDSTNDTQ